MKQVLMILVICIISAIIQTMMENLLKITIRSPIIGSLGAKIYYGAFWLILTIITLEILDQVK